MSDHPILQLTSLAEPERHRRRLHALGRHPEKVVAELIEIDLGAQSPRETVDDVGSVVSGSVEPLVNE